MLWKIERKGNDKIYKSDKCELKIVDKGEKSNVHVNYKGYNLLMPMGIWGFEDEIQERNIAYVIHGEHGCMNQWYFSVENKDLRMFIDLIYFFFDEHDMDGTLNEKLRIHAWQLYYVR